MKPKIGCACSDPTSHQYDNCPELNPENEMNIFQHIAAWFRSTGKRSNYCSLCGDSTHTIENCTMRKD